MRTIILGGTGFIGRHLAVALAKRGHQVVIPSRDPDKVARMFKHKAFVPAHWSGTVACEWAEQAEGAHAVVNLAGESIGARRWTPEQKQRISMSRLDAGRSVVAAFSQAEDKPKVLIQGSATGFYGPRGDEELDESAESGEGFLAATAKAWEKSTDAVENMGVRRAVVRTGVVLGKKGGALEKFLAPFRMYMGGTIGSGRQWLSWIHIEDEVRAIAHLIESADAHGAYNLTAPAPATMRDFCKTLGKALGRPAWLPTPSLALKLMLGEMAEELILTGQRAVPKRLLESGYEFKHPDLSEALNSCL